MSAHLPHLVSGFPRLVPLLFAASLAGCGGGGGGGSAGGIGAWVQVGSYSGAYQGSALGVGVVPLTENRGLLVFSGPNWGNGGFACDPQPIKALSIAGNGAISDGQSYLTAGRSPIHAREAAVADFNGDGQADLLMGSHGCDNPPFPGELNSLLMHEAGALVDRSAGLPAFNGFTHSVTAADLRRVGRSDVLVGLLGLAYDPTADASLLNRGNTPFPDAPYFGSYLLRGEADGSLTYDTESLPDRIAKLGDGSDSNGRFTAALLADIDGDEFPDLIVGSDGTAPVAGYAWLNDGLGGFRTDEIPLPAGAFGAHGTIVGDIKTFDVDGVGSPEVLLTQTTVSPFYGSERVQVLRYNGNGFDDITEQVIDFGTRQGWSQFAHFADLDGDGCDDLVLYKETPNPADTLIFVCRDGRLEPSVSAPADRAGLLPVTIGGRRFLLSVRAPMNTSELRVVSYELR